MPPRLKGPTQQSLAGIARVISASVAPSRFLLIAVETPLTGARIDDGTLHTNMNDDEVLTVIAHVVDEIKRRR